MCSIRLFSTSTFTKGENMKKALMLLAILLGLTAIVVAGIDFSGTWAPNAEKSDPAPARGGGGGGGGRGGGAPTDLVIKQTGNEMVITQTMGENTMETKYIMDGAEHTNASQMGDTKYKAVLSGNTVSVTGTRTTQRGDMPLKVSYTLSEDGKAMTVATARVGQDGTETVRKQVYDKK
jgi:hypothetical protein